MNRFLIILVLVVLCESGLAQSRTSAPQSDECKNPQTQLQLNECAGIGSRKAEAEMNSVYKELLARASGNPAYRQKLEAAQKAWLAYRDAELEAKYPARNKRAEYGSVYPMCVSNDRADLTRRRTAELKALLEENEGDVCVGEWARSTSR